MLSRNKIVSIMFKVLLILNGVALIYSLFNKEVLDTWITNFITFSTLIFTIIKFEIKFKSERPRVYFNSTNKENYRDICLNESKSPNYEFEIINIGMTTAVNIQLETSFNQIKKLSKLLKKLGYNISLNENDYVIIRNSYSKTIKSVYSYRNEVSNISILGKNGKGLISIPRVYTYMINFIFSSLTIDNFKILSSDFPMLTFKLKYEDLNGKKYEESFGVKVNIIGGRFNKENKLENLEIGTNIIKI